MKTFPFSAVALAAVVFLAAGCGHLDIQPDGDPERVLTGTVNFHAPDPLPSDMVVTVRLIDPAGATDVTANGSDVAPAADASQMGRLGRSGVPMVLGEQKIENAGSPPVAFRIEYRANDDQLRHGLNLEARVSIGGKLRFYNVNGYGVILAKATQPQEVWVNPTASQ